MSAGCGHRAVDQGPVAVDPSRQQSGILIFRWHDHAEPFKAAEVFGQRQGYAWATVCKRRIRHGILFEFGDIGNARIFDAPDFFRVVARIGYQCRLGIDAPSVDSIFRTRRAQVRQAAAIFHAA